MEDVGVRPILAPSEVVDQVWHAHIMRPHLYMRLCEELGMGVIAYDPDTALDIDNHITGVWGGAWSLWHKPALHTAMLALPAPHGRAEVGPRILLPDLRVASVPPRMLNTSNPISIGTEASKVHGAGTGHPHKFEAGIASKGKKVASQILHGRVDAKKNIARPRSTPEEPFLVDVFMLGTDLPFPVRVKGTTKARRMYRFFDSRGFQPGGYRLMCGDVWLQEDDSMDDLGLGEGDEIIITPV
eukprot:gene31162-6298_t